MHDDRLENVACSARQLNRREFISTTGAAMFAVMLAPIKGRAASSTVAIVQGDNPDQMVAQAVELLGGLKDLFQDGKTIVIKPNLTGVGVAGMATDSRVGRGLVKLVKQTAQCQLAFAEGLNGGGLWEASGFAKVAQDEDVQLVHLGERPFVPVPLDGLALKQYHYPELVKNCDVFVDLPVMKTHRLTGISGAMKNLYGLLPLPRDIHHTVAEKILPDLAQIRKPDLVLMDALVAMEGQGPLNGTSMPMHLILAGRDLVAVDAVCAALMGIDPAQIEHLNNAHDRGLGENDLHNIAIKGVPIDRAKKTFKLARWFIRMEMPGTAEAVQRVRSVADKVTELDSGRAGYSVQIHAERMKVDRSKFPKFDPSGFNVSMDRRGRKLAFDAEYYVPSLDNRRATEESIKTWIKENLGPLATVVPTVLPLGG